MRTRLLTKQAWDSLALLGNTLMCRVEFEQEIKSAQWHVSISAPTCPACGVHSRLVPSDAALCNINDTEL